MVNEELEKKFERPEFKELIKDHRNSTIWDLVLIAISLLCLIIISFAPCIEMNGEKFYKNYMYAFRTEYISSKGNMSTDKDSPELVQARSNAIILVMQKMCNQDDPDSVELAEDLSEALTFGILAIPMDDYAEFRTTVAKKALEFSELKFSYSMVDFGKMVLGETKLKEEGVGIFTVSGFGNFFAIIAPIAYFAVLLEEVIMLVFSIVKLCINKKYTQYMYNKRNTEYKQKKAKIRGGMQSISVFFYIVFAIFYFCSHSDFKFMKDPARIFFGALKISPLFYVMLGISAIVFIMSLINLFRKKNIHYWMCTHA